MQTAKMYKGRRTVSGESHHLHRCVLYTLVTGLIIFAVLLLLLSLAEWLLPNADNESLAYLADVLPFLGIWIAVYLGSRRLGRAAIRFGTICGFSCWLIGLCMAWCIGIVITVEWLLISASLCIGTALIGAIAGLLIRR